MSLSRRDFIGAVAAGAIVYPARARADFFESLRDGFLSGWNQTPQSIAKAMQSQVMRLATAETDRASAQAEAFFQDRRISANLDETCSSPASMRAHATDFRRALRSMPAQGTALDIKTAAALGERAVQPLAGIDDVLLSHELLDAGYVYIPAGCTAGVNFDGLCLDQSLPAPGYGDRLRFLPISTVTDNKTAAAMRAIARTTRKYVESSDQKHMAKAEMQSLVWALRAMQTGASPHLNDFQKKMLAVLDPNGFGHGGLLDSIGWRVGMAAGRDARRAFGGLVDLSNMGDVSRRMEEISRQQNRPAAAGSPYSTMQPNVYAVSFGTSPLAGRAVIANANQHPVLLEMHAYIAESANETQRILITGVAAPQSWAGTIDKIFQELLSEGVQLAAKYSLELFPEAAEHFGAMPKSVLGRSLIKNIPVLNNAIAAAELYYGYEWTELLKPEAERTPMNAAERLLALAGTIPGAGALVRLVGKDALPVLLKKAAQAVDRTEAKRDAAGLLLAIYEPLHQKAASIYESSQDPVLMASVEQLEPAALDAVAAVRRL